MAVVLKGVGGADDAEEIGRTAPAIVIERGVEAGVVESDGGKGVFGEEFARVEKVAAEGVGEEIRDADFAG